MDTEAAKKQRRWGFRFSLRTLLIMTAIFAVLCVWYRVLSSEAEHQRLVAETVEAVRGSVVYDWQVRDPDDTSTTPLAPPPSTWLREKLGPHWFDRIVRVELNEFANSSRKNKKRFSVLGPKLVGLSSLRSLWLWGKERDQADFELLGQLTQLEKLELRHPSVVNEQLSQALVGLKRLKELNLNAPVTPLALRHLAKLPQLETLKLSCDVIDRKTGEPLKEHWTTDEHAVEISKFPHLNTLEIWNTVITDDGVAAIGRMTNLESLTVVSWSVTSAGLDHVTRLKNLKQLAPRCWQLDDKDMVRFQEFPQLESLDLAITNLSDDGLSNISPLTQLTWLRLGGKKITDKGIHQLHGLTNLEGLSLTGTSVHKHSDEVARLQKALPNCRIRLPKTKEEKRIEARWFLRK